MQKFLIVGGGLAGVSLATMLLDRGCKVTVVDSGVNVSSRVAAGMINPMVFRRMTKSWRLDEFLPFALDFYRTMEAKTHSQFLNHVVIRRFFSSIQERNFWLERQENPAFTNYLNPVTEEDESAHPYANEFGSGRVKNSYFLSTNVLLDALLAQDGMELLTEVFDYQSLEVDSMTYKGIQYDEVVFCEGYQSKNNPWFSYLPVDSTKGETLVVETAGLSEKESLNRKCFSLHLGEGKFRIGATYVWHTDTTTITQEGKDLLLENLSYLTDAEVKVVDQVAGVRPTTRDRRPFMGRHAEHSKLSVFNGLGAKGYLMAPLLAKEMCDFLLDGNEIHKECRIERIK